MEQKSRNVQVRDVEGIATNNHSRTLPWMMITEKWPQFPFDQTRPDLDLKSGS